MNVAYMLGDVCDAPFVRLTPTEGGDASIERFLREAWTAHLRTGAGKRLSRRRYVVRLQVEADVVDDEVQRAFVEVVRGSRESSFDAAFFGALRATGCLAGMPLAWSQGARAVLMDAIFEVPDADRSPSLGEAFARQVHDPLARLVRSGLLAFGRHDLGLRIALAPRDRWHVAVTRGVEPMRSLFLGALAGAGLLADPTDERVGETQDVPLRVHVRDPEPRATTMALEDD